MENKNGDIPEKVMKDLDTMMHHAMRVSSITGNLLSFSRESSYEFKSQDVNKIIEKVLMFLEASISAKGITMEKYLATSLPLVFGSRGGLEQVFLNIVHNAMDATKNGGKIKIETKNGIIPPFPPLEKGAGYPSSGWVGGFSSSLQRDFYYHFLS